MLFLRYYDMALRCAHFRKYLILGDFISLVFQVEYLYTALDLRF
jgi:hypothetical protein